MTNKIKTIDEMAAFCKRKGFVYPNSEIYGGIAGFFDYGPYGSEVKNNLKQDWWKTFVQQRDDVVGIDGSIITHPTVWVASGHAGSFADIMVTCSNPKCKTKVRADQYIEEKLNFPADGMKAETINAVFAENDLRCPECGEKFLPANDFNLMFTTQVGPEEGSDSMAYLRPETAQLMFTNFRLVVENSRLKLPFGIAQMGKAFRNEISPRGFLFRCREFEQMEIEYFIHPDANNKCPYIDEILNHKMLYVDAKMQDTEGENLPEEKASMKQLLDKGIIMTQWHAYWLSIVHEWYTNLGATPDNFRIRQHVATEKSHYALDTWDLEYHFPFGWKELVGIANRTDFDLKQHIEYSKNDLSLFDEETKTKIIPHVVAEPSLGVDRSFLVFMIDAYNDDQERGNIVLKLHPKLAPVKVGVFPLVNKLHDEAMEIYNDLKKSFIAKYDKSGSVGRRYARADEIGTPYCVTVDFDTKEKGLVTIRDRDTTKQIVVKLDELKEVLDKLLKEEIEFEKAGEPVKAKGE